jgi:hypothetical protein
MRCWSAPAGGIMSKPTLRPGNTTPRSGQYEEVGPRGGRTGHEVTSTEGHPLPPTRKPGRGYIPVDLTRHERPRR